MTSKEIQENSNSYDTDSDSFLGFRNIMISVNQEMPFSLA